MKGPKLSSQLFKETRGAVSLRIDRGSALLEGRVPTWEEKIRLGYRAVSLGTRGVVNDIEVDGVPPESLAAPEVRDSRLEGKSYDVAVIGGGVIGCAIARELSKWDLRTVLLEKEYDLAVHTSSRNDGMIHDGFAAKPGTAKARYNVRGNRAWEGLASELGIEFRRPGSLVIFSSRTMAALYPLMAARAAENGVDGYEAWSRKRLLAEEPHVCDGQHGAMFLPSAGILSPYKATVALAESAVANGVEVVLDCATLGFEREGGRITAVRTNRGSFRAGAVVNAAGNWADVVAGMADDRFFSLHQRRGVDLILDANVGRYQRHIMSMPSIFQVKEKTKGGGLVLTLEGNILVGPTAEEAPGRENYATHPADLRTLERHLKVNRKLSQSQAITYFAGVRPCTYEEDFVVGRSERVANLVHAAGIQSPGLASAPAIAEDVARDAIAILREAREVRPNARFVARREAPPELKRMPFEARAALIAKNPSYGRIVCRCEEISEGEILDALSSPVPVSALDAVKRRARAGMGRCHGGFCTPRAIEIIAAARGIPMTAVTKKGEGSELLARETKGGSR